MPQTTKIEFLTLTVKVVAKLSHTCGQSATIPESIVSWYKNQSVKSYFSVDDLQNTEKNIKFSKIYI